MPLQYCFRPILSSRTARATSAAGTAVTGKPNAGRRSASTAVDARGVDRLLDRVVMATYCGSHTAVVCDKLPSEGGEHCKRDGASEVGFIDAEMTNRRIELIVGRPCVVREGGIL